MKYPRCIVLVILVFSTILTQGQKIKYNERRAAGLVPYPRIGRHLAMASYARTDGNVGLVNLPRVGRSGSSPSLANFESAGPRDFEHKIEDDRDFDMNNFDDFDYSGNYPDDLEESRKRLEALRNGLWLDGGRSINGDKKEHRRTNRCNQQVDGPWAVLFATRDLSSFDQQPIHNFIPRMVREVEHDTASTNNAI